MSKYKYQIKEEIRGDGNSVFLPMYAEDKSDTFFAVDDYGQWLINYEDALECINAFEKRTLHSIVVDTIIHPITFQYK